ncbi:MAG: PIG-L deacetylase family protein [Bacillota bacterium]
MELRVKDLLLIPDLLQTRRLLCVQAHPDDAEIGAGATLARLAEAGTEITYLTVTDGSMGTEDPALLPEQLKFIRRREGETAARVVGALETMWLDYPDGGALDLAAVRFAITRALRLVRPDTLMVNDPWLLYEAHSDHRLTGLAAAEACLFCGLPHYCPWDLADGLAPHKVSTVAFYATSHPNTYIDVTASWPKKLAALKSHVSQFSPEMLEMLTFYLTVKAGEQAAGRGCGLVEAFKVLTPMHLHYFEEAWRC